MMIPFNRPYLTTAEAAFVDGYARGKSHMRCDFLVVFYRYVFKNILGINFLGKILTLFEGLDLNRALRMARCYAYLDATSLAFQIF
jgi:hypothetical protein